LKLKSLAAASALLVLPSLARPASAGETPTDTVTSCRATEAPRQYSVLRIVVNDRNRKESWPDGCVLRLTAYSGLTLVIRIEDRNVRLYRVLFDEKTEQLPEVEAVPAALAKYLDIKLPAPKVPADMTAVGRPPEKDPLTLFHQTNARFESIAKALKNARGAMDTAEDYAGLRKAVLKELADPLPHLDACARGDSDDCAMALLALPREIEPDFQVLAGARTALVEEARLPGASLSSKYLAEMVSAKYDTARKVGDGLPAITKELAGLFNEEDTKASLFVTQKTFEFKGEPLTVRVRVQGGDEKSPTTFYGFEVRLEPEKTAHFAFSTGFMFTSVVDRAYAVANGKIAEKGDTDDVHAGVGVLAHWLFPGSGFAASAGIVGTDASVQYLVGLSYLLGEKQHFVVSAGAAVGSVQRLDKVAEGDPFAESTVPTKDVTRVGTFAGVSFKF